MGSREGTGIELGFLEIQSSRLSAGTVWLLTSPLRQICLLPMMFSHPLPTGSFQSASYCASRLHLAVLIILLFSKCSALWAPVIPHGLILFWSLCCLSDSVVGSWLSFTPIWCSYRSVLYLLSVLLYIFLAVISFILMVSSSTPMLPDSHPLHSFLMPELQKRVFSSLLDISPWTSPRHFKFNTS